MPRNWRTTLFLATQTGTQPDEVIYPALSDEFESPSLDNVPLDPIWYKSPDSSRQNVSDTHLTLMKIRRMQRREKERAREEPEVMEEESLANSLAAISIDSESNNVQEKSSSVRSFTSTFKPQYGTRALTGNVLEPEAHPSLGDSASNASSERRSSQGTSVFIPAYLIIYRSVFFRPSPTEQKLSSLSVPSAISNPGRGTFAMILYASFTLHGMFTYNW
ncbi:uncharacterized protein EV420DRAFT_1635966 [Desarmillaria tabescens]|uniref:Uncharacterized protein n=1 Tax=Armillaria tabescens TaxID=1929756 RepID=A0AA39T621_ARMTA|nr:uncharacterized protein EV420DRAFT_1635966 [Desarmillaria tabescens]KAK0466931.1 hypothetical protein EV420DRAFT_1635966 [Desarmillaria tabescens]